MSEPTTEVLETITKGLIEAEVFIESATAADLRDILSPEVVENIDSITKSAIQSAVDKEPVMASENDLNESVEVEDLEKQLAEAQETLASVIAERDELVEKALALEDDEPEEEIIEKAFETLPESVVEILKGEREERDRLRAELAIEREARLDETYITKAADYNTVVDDPETFGPVLRRIASFDSEAADLIEKILGAAQERIEKGALFEEAGVNGEGPVGGDAEAEATSIAKSYMEKDDNLTMELARSKVWEQRPDLYDEYLAERRAATRNA